MPNFADDIRDFVRGDNLDLERNVTGIPPGRYVTQGWFTVKKSPAVPDASALTQKTITTTSNASGQILDSGQISGTAVFRFKLTPTDTAKYTAAYPWDIQLLLDDGSLYTPFTGTILGRPGITDAIS